MKFKKKFLYLFLLLFPKFCLATSQDGTSSLVYLSTLWSAADTNYARGFVRLANGFSVPANAEVTLDTHVSVSGQINLNSTGILRLTSDLKLDSGVTFASGGKIYGCALILNGDLTIPDNEILEITGDTIIDGMGHNLILGHRSQLMVDDNITLTLRNLNLKNTLNTQNVELLNLTSNRSKLALDNVTIKTVDDCYFNKGQLFIHNDVGFSGTSKFIYNSTQASFITHCACLEFEPDTSFFYNPACTDKDLIVMQDESSSLYLNGCTLQATNTGLRLTTGKLFFDNSCTVSCNSNEILTSITEELSEDFATNVRSASWSPDGIYLAAGGENGTKDLIVYSFDGTTLTEITSEDFTTRVYFVAWSPDGKYLAVVGTNGTKNLIVYSFNGTTLTEIDSVNLNTTVYEVSWSPDGKYLSVCSNNSGVDNLIVYSFDGAGLTEITTQDFGTYPHSAPWSPDGRYLAVGGNNGATALIVYSFNTKTLTEIPGCVKAFGTYANYVAWSPDGKYLVVGGSNTTKDLIVYSFNGTTLTEISGCVKDLGVIFFVIWSLDGKYLAVGGDVSTDLIIYGFDGSNLTEIDSDAWVTSARGASWSPDGKYLAVGGINGDKNLIVYLNNYVYSPQGQSESTSIILGDSSLGADYDLDVTILPGANVILDGYLFFDDAT